MTARVIMLQGTGSDVGKSVLTAALCRIAQQRGLSVAPFKPQNMSNNAAACADGGEIGRAQALQARAAGLAPHVDMNPVLLKPQTDQTAQVILHGKAIDSMQAADYMANRYQLMEAVLASFERMTTNYDLVIVEGAGSPAEINLREHDIANMGFARRAQIPVVLVGDIDRGGVIASLVGTQTVIDPGDSAYIQAFLINKFRGDPGLFHAGVLATEQLTHWPCLGVIPWLSAAARLPAEDAVALNKPGTSDGTGLKIAAPMLSRMANFDDADPLMMEPSIDFCWVAPGQAIPRDAEVVILFGSKSTLGDLAFLRAQGWDHDILAHARAGGRVLGLCGGYQMLGLSISDPEGVDGEAGIVAGLGLLDVETTMTPTKRVSLVQGHCAIDGTAVSGYEIHTGVTSGAATSRPMVELRAAPDGARSADGRIEGTYIHGIFSSDDYRRCWLERCGGIAKEGLDYGAEVDSALDELAAGVSNALDVDRFLQLAQRPGWRPPTI